MGRRCRSCAPTRHSSGGWNPGAQRTAGRLGERVLSPPSFQRRLESRRAARGGSVGGEGTQPPVIPAEAGIQARSARRVGWGRGYSATRHSSGGWNPGAQRAAGRLGERVLSHPSFQRRLESRRASARWVGWGRGYSATRHSSGGWNPGAQRRAEPPARWVGWGRGYSAPVIPAEAGIQARKRSVGRLGGEGTAGVGCGVRAWPAQRNERGLSATLDSSLRWNDEASSGRRALSNGAHAPHPHRSRIDTRALRW